MKRTQWGHLAKPLSYVVVLMLLVVGLAGCGLTANTPTPAATAAATQAVTPAATATATQAVTPTASVEPTAGLDTGAEEGTIRVPLVVLQAPDGSTLALVPVTINGQGPFRFALDTGASKSLIDATLSDQLGLPVVGNAGQVTGVTGAANAELVSVTNWQAGSVVLNQNQIIRLDLGGASGGGQLQGLLGSDILSTYGAIQVDYVNQVLILTPR
jgi:Aspartyl protease